MVLNSVLFRKITKVAGEDGSTTKFLDTGSTEVPSEGEDAGFSAHEIMPPFMSVIRSEPTCPYGHSYIAGSCREAV